MMPRTLAGWTAIVSLLLLLATNAFWFLVSVDAGISATYRDQQLGEYREALREARLLLPAVRPAVSKSELVDRAKSITHSEVFEKDGCVWIGHLGFQFDEAGRLIHVSPTWNSGEVDPCFPD